MQNIILFNQDEMTPTIGGIARINCNLHDALKKKGVNCILLSAEHQEGFKPYCTQFHLPDSKECDSAKNVGWLHQFIEDEDISVIINSDFRISSIKLLDTARQGTNCKIISWIHNNVVEYGSLVGFRKEKELKEKHLGILFSLLTTRFALTTFRLLAKRKHSGTANEIYKRSDRVMTVCDGNISEFVFLLGHNDSDNKILSIPNFITSIAEEVHPEEKQNSVVWCGAVNFDLKKTNWMLDIWREIQEQFPDWTLTIMGDGLQLQEIKDYAKELGTERVVFCGRVNPDEYYRKASIICSTSISESFGLTIVEGMQRKAVPVAFGSSASIKEIIGCNGILVQPFDKKRFIKSLSSLMKQDALRLFLAEKSRIAAYQYDEEYVIRLWMQILNQL